MNLVLDVSHHQKIDYKMVAPHIKGVIIRVAFGKVKDTLFEQHYAGFKAEGTPIAGFQWFRPDQDVKEQIEVVKVACDNKDIRVMFSDQEQQGAYNVPLSVYSAERLSTLASQHMSGLALHGFDMGIYSRSTWIMQYAKPMLDWIYQYSTWMASWPFAKTVVTCSWETLMNTWAPKVFSPYFASGWPEDKKRADIWQWSGDKFILPGIYTSATGAPRTTDLNYVSDAMLARFIGTPSQPELPNPLPDNIYYELADLLNSMDLSHESQIKEIKYIMGLIKPGG